MMKWRSLQENCYWCWFHGGHVTCSNRFVTLATMVRCDFSCSTSTQVMSFLWLSTTIIFLWLLWDSFHRFLGNTVMQPIRWFSQAAWQGKGARCVTTSLCTVQLLILPPIINHVELTLTFSMLQVPWHWRQCSHGTWQCTMFVAVPDICSTDDGLAWPTNIVIIIWPVHQSSQMVAFMSIDVLGASVRSVCQHLTHLVTTLTVGSVDPQVFTYPQMCGFFIVTNSFMNRAEHLGPVFIVIWHSVDICLHGSLFSLSLHHFTNSPFCPPLTSQVCTAIAIDMCTALARFFIKHFCTPKLWLKPEPSPSPGGLRLKAQAWNLASPGSRKLSLSCGFQAEPGLHITNLNPELSSISLN